MNKKLMAVPMLVIVALVMTGFAYAMWYDTLTINGTIETGELDWGFTSWSCLDTGVDYHCRDGFAGPPPYFWPDPEGKDIGSQTIRGLDTDSDGDFDTVELNLTDVYPSYFTAVSVYMENTGTIPIILEHVVIDDTEIWTNYVTVQIDLDGDGTNDIEVYWGNHIGHQFDPGVPPPEISFWIHVLQVPANEGAEFSFTIQLVGIQWNYYD